MKIRVKLSGEVYYADYWENRDVRIDEDDRPKDTTDWAAFRGEAAKDILCSMVRGGYGRGREKEQAKLAVEYADELIKHLWEDGE